MRIIRSSEISSFVFCKRSWMFQRDGVESDNPDMLTGGVELHRRHGRQMLMTNLIRFAAYILLLLALVMFAVYLTNQFI